jgi:hypothetical protein
MGTPAAAPAASQESKDLEFLANSVDFQKLSPEDQKAVVNFLRERRQKDGLSFTITDTGGPYADDIDQGAPR